MIDAAPYPKPSHGSLICTALDCPNYFPVDEDIGGVCTNYGSDFTMCLYGCVNGLCPRGFKR